jgi:hypothetical protein
VCEVKRRCKERRFTASQHAVTALARYDSGNLSKQNVMEGNGISEVPIATSLPESIHFVVNYDGGERRPIINLLYQGFKQRMR